ncbi:MAG: alpha/beta hydrolase, partial [Planctomycetes bacterium]|nr:alpha/beta hydrolase [Planctomycetota bacterium]
MIDFILDRWLILIPVMVALVLAWIVAVLSKYVRLMLNIFRDTAPPLMGAAENGNVAGHPFRFRAFDGTQLAGRFLSRSAYQGSGNVAGTGILKLSKSNADYLPDTTRGVIIFCHEYGYDQHSCLKYCRGLVEQGFDVFTFDFRSHGSSGSLESYQPRLWSTDKEVSDCLGALLFVRSELEARNLPFNVGFFGISRGAGAAILAAAQGRYILPVKAVLADGAFSTDTTLEWYMKKWVHIFARVRFVYERHRPSFWHFLRWLLLIIASRRLKCRFPSVRKTVHRFPKIPVFFIHGAKDSYIKPDHTRMLYEAAHAPRYLWIVPNARHNQSVSTEPKLYADRMIGFFTQFLT